MEFDVKKVAALVVGVLLATVATASAQEKDKLNVALNWLPQGLHMGAIAAVELGYYDKVNIDPKITRGYGSGDTVNRVGTGTEDVAFSDASSVIIGVSKGLQLKMVGMLLDKGVDAVYAIGGRGIEKLKDLEGQPAGATAGEAALNLMPALGEKAGFDFKKVQVVNMIPPSRIPALVSGQVKSIITFATDRPIVEDLAKKKNLKVIEFLFSDLGVDRYSIGFIARNELIEKNPGLIKRFLDATLRGYAWAIANQDAAVKIFMKRYPENDEPTVRAQFALIAKHMQTDMTRKHGLGYIDRAKMSETIRLIASFSDLPKPVTPEDVYTLVALPKVAVPQ